MKQVRVTDPSGRDWVVRRRWLPWSVRWRGPLRPRKKQKKESTDPGWLDFLDFGEPFLDFDEGFGGFVAVVVVIFLVVVGVLLVFPLFIFIVELLLVMLVVAAALVARVLFRRPWLVDALTVEGKPRRAPDLEGRRLAGQRGRRGSDRRADPGRLADAERSGSDPRERRILKFLLDFHTVGM